MAGVSHEHNKRKKGRKYETVVGNQVITYQFILCSICGRTMENRIVKKRTSKLRKLFGNKAGKRFDFSPEDEGKKK